MEGKSYTGILITSILSVIGPPFPIIPSAPGYATVFVQKYLLLSLAMYSLIQLRELGQHRLNKTCPLFYHVVSFNHCHME